ncbi:MAG TPA: iron ABC transporter substrate-binding protein [Mycobacterium sp.]|mgnify:CR=1 FL=1|nr:iron ABC transporter substrate-binding protein [Mycobacterium sp.]HPZ94764.1 iron ABC transporter substrate-binding protein [Mycobacterium sp.]HQE15561.1 iron ABC transporter substrate-binding protein [Mycobacterium sp.]
MRSRRPASTRFRASTAAILAVLLALPLIAACNRGEESERALTIYSGRSEELVGPLFRQFTEQTGIKVEARYGDSAELAAQILEEGAGSPAQVFFAQDAGALGAVEAAGLFATLPEGAAAAVPADYRAPDGTWTGVTGRARVIAYDPQQVPAAEVPKSVADLTDPTWRGQVAIAPTNASFQAFVTAMRVADGDEVTRRWLEGMVRNEAQRFEKNGLILDAVDTGQVKLGLINHYYWYEKAAEVGAAGMRAKIAFTAPGDPGSLVNVAGVGVLKSAGESAESATFVEWLLSPETQRWFVTNTYEYPLVPNVPVADGLPPLNSLRGPDVALADLDSLPATLAMLEDVGLL